MHPPQTLELVEFRDTLLARVACPDRSAVQRYDNAVVEIQKRLQAGESAEEVAETAEAAKHKLKQDLGL